MRAGAVVATCAVIAMVTVWLVAGMTAEAPAAAAPALMIDDPPPPVDAGIAAPPVAAPVPEAPRVAEAPPSVRIRVRRDGLPAVGLRVALEDEEKRREEGLVDVMGLLHLPLHPGVWRTVGSGVQRLLTVQPGVEDYTLHVTDGRTLSGRVVTEQGTPVSGADLEAGEVRGISRYDGSFSLRVDGASTVVRARKGRFASEPLQVDLPAAAVVLTVEALQPILVTTRRPALVMVRHRGGLCSPCERGVLPGPVTLTAVAVEDGRRWRAQVDDVVKRDERFVRELALEAAPPLRGKVVNQFGAPVPGVTLRPRVLDWSLLPSTAPTALRPLVTDAEGRFEVTALVDRPFRFEVDPPLRVEDRVFGPDAEVLELLISE